MSTTTTAVPLTAQDRCDRCGAQAYVQTQQPSGFDLLWCAHHYREHGLELVAAGATIVVDNMAELTTPPKSDDES